MTLQEVFGIELPIIQPPITGAFSALFATAADKSFPFTAALSVLSQRGFARTLVFPPNTRHAGLFARLQQHAADAGRGLWGSC